jgi:hypothetical protein
MNNFKIEDLKSQGVVLAEGEGHEPSTEHKQIVDLLKLGFEQS